MESWYLLYCKRGQLSRAQKHLKWQAVNCFSPIITLEKILRSKRIAISELLFPNYLFVLFDPERIHTATLSALTYHYPQRYSGCQPLFALWYAAGHYTL